MPITEGAVHLDFSECAVPYYIKNDFKLSIIYQDDSYPVDATCVIYSPKKVVTVVFIIKRKFEDALKNWLVTHNEKLFDTCCRRRELYCHETSHLIAIIRAFPSNRSSKVREDFILKISAKFKESIDIAEDSMAIPLVFSEEKPDDSPSIFDKDHFRYENDDLDYFSLYAELMLDYDTMYNALKQIIDSGEEQIRLKDVSLKTLVPINFFQTFPQKITALKDILARWY